MPLDTIGDVFCDALIDTVKLIPFLFATYVAMETLEHAAAGKTERLVAQAGKSGPALGALVGALPQCGFSAMAATLYAGRVITVGTLVAVVLSTSDEMIPVFLAHAAAPTRILAILAIKVCAGCITGFLIDAVLRLRHHVLFSKEGDTREGLAELVHEHDHAHTHTHNHVHEHTHKSNGMTHILSSALSHTVEVTLFIFLVSFMFGLFIEYIGEDNLGVLLSVHPVRSTLLAALVGLIPNCGASVALTELFLAGTLPTGAMLAGLLASGGVGFLVLFRTNNNLRQNVCILAATYAVAVVCGLAVGASGILL